MTTITPPKLEPDQEYHAFISHCTEDKDTVEQIRNKLEENSFKCCDVESDFLPNSSVVKNIEKCITESQKVILVLSSTFDKSTWVNFEVGVALRKEGETKKVTIIPIVLGVEIAKLPPSIRRHNALKWGEPDFWKKLFAALCVEEISTLVPSGNIANGLAWSYFYGYLKLVLPGMQNRVAESEFLKKEETKDIPFLDKMMIILPDSGFCPSSLNADDKNVSHVGFIPFKASRAGNINRDYKSSVYKVTDPESKKEVLVIAEFATPLMSMYEMEIGEIAGLSKQEKLEQKLKFEEKLEEILQSSNCKDAYCYLSFDDNRDEKKTPVGWSLSEIIATKAFDQLNLLKRIQEAKSDDQKRH